MAEHYVVIPARPNKPKDKAKVELSVKLAQRWILARIRNEQFFSIEELNTRIRALLEYFNKKIMIKFGKNRYDLYVELDKPALIILPKERYEFREFKYSRVNIDYHAEVDGCYYSVPYQLTGKEVEVYYTVHSVEIYFSGKRIAWHRRIYKRGEYSTQKEHMAAAHRAMANGYSVYYTRLNNLLSEIALIRATGSYLSWLKKLSKIRIIIIDDFGVCPMKAQDAQELLEIIEDCTISGGVIITSQLSVDQWHSYLSNPLVADAVLDRLIHNSHRLNLDGESMRKLRSAL